MATHVITSNGIVAELQTSSDFVEREGSISFFGAYLYGETVNDRYMRNDIVSMIYFDTTKIPSLASLKYKQNLKCSIKFIAVGYKSSSASGKALWIDSGSQRTISATIGASNESAGSLVNMNWQQLMALGDQRITFQGTKILSQASEYWNINYDDKTFWPCEKPCVFLETKQSVSNGVYYGGCIAGIDTANNIQLIFSYDDVIPEVKASYPTNNAKIEKSNPVTFKWTFSESKNVGQKSVRFFGQCGGEYFDVTVTQSANWYTFPANYFKQGQMTYIITVTNNDDQQAVTDTQYAEVVPSYPSVEATYPVNVGVQKSQAFTLSWKFNETSATGQKSYKIEITQNGVTDTIEKQGSDTAYTFPARKFTDGAVTYYITVTNNDGESDTAGPYTFNIISSVPNISAVYPVDVLVKRSKEFSLAWNYNEDTPVGQTQYWLDMTKDGVTTTYTNETGNHYHTFASNALESGEWTYKIKVKNADGQYASAGPYAFILVGDSDAPDITNVTNDAKPTISWTIESQDAFEIEIYDNNDNAVYKSGLIIEKETRIFQINTMLKNGTYVIKMRALNIYGYYTPWGSYYLTLNATCASEITSVYVFITNEYGVSVSCTKTGGTAYVIRKMEDGEEEIQGEYQDGFTDYTTPLNKPCQYAVRLYDVGIVDSQWNIANLNTEKVILRDSRNELNYIELWITETEEFTVLADDSRSKSLMQCIGRTYPIKETGEWKNSKRTISAYVSMNDYRKMVDMEVNGTTVGFQADGEYMLCDLDVNDDGPHFGGRNITAVLTRVDGE